MARQHYATLDAMRGVAALMVATFHFNSEIFPHAYLAVDFFFMLSGFVIAEAYERELGGSMSFLAFAKKRVIRLWPLYALGLGLAATYLILRAGMGKGDYPLAQVLTVTAVETVMSPVPPVLSWGDGLYPINFPAWSLFFELIANAAYALAVPFLTTSRLATFVALAALALVATSAFGGLNSGSVWGEFGGGLTRVAFGFSAGVLLWRIRKQAAPVANLPGVLAACVVLIAILGVGKPSIIGDLVITLAICPLLVAAGSRVAPMGWLAAPAAWLGAISYAVYVLHVPIRMWVRPVLNAVEIEMGSQQTVALMLVAVVTGATLADRFFDAPVRRWLTGLKVPRPTFAA